MAQRMSDRSRAAPADGSFEAARGRLATGGSAPRRPVGRSWLVPAFVLSLMLAIYAPLLRSGTLLLLDYSDYPAGPHASLGAYVWGFRPDLTSRAPINGALLVLFRLLPWGPVKLLPLLLVVPLAAWGFQRLFDRRSLATIAATLMFVVNPFVYERMLAGQVYLVLGYALLPLLVSALLSRVDGVTAPIGAGLLLALLMALSPHFVFIGGLLWLVVAVAALRRDGVRTLRRTGLTLLVALLASLYWLIPIASRAGELDRVTATDLKTFQTVSDPALGLAPNVAGLYGFWRIGWPLPKDNLPAWPLLLAAILVVAAIGLRACGSERWSTLRSLLVIAGAAGFVLSLGAQGPTGPAFRFLFDHVPGFRIMREPGKFEALLALAYAGFFGLGFFTLVDGSRSQKWRAMMAVVILAVPCAYTFRMFWGFDGYVRPSDYPRSWTEAAALMGTGPGKVLAVPGDQYLAFPWTEERAVASPMDSFFGRDVIIDGGLDLGGLESQTADARSRYLQFVTDHGPQVTRFGNLVAPLGVRFVLLVKTGDWARYSWLERQTDLRLLAEWPDLELFGNVEPVSTAYAPESSVTVQDWGEVVGLAEQVRLTDLVVSVRTAGPGPIRSPQISLPASTGRPLQELDSSPVGFDVRLPGRGWIVLTEAFDPAWRLDGRAPTVNLGVTNAFQAPPAASIAKARYGRWPLVRTSFLLSLASILASVVAMAVSARQRRTRRRAAR
jgi:hypothetical protein